MGKNMYSLMLSEDVVSLIDGMAAGAGTNRSNYINNILAEYVSYRTPEMRIKELMEQLDAMFSPRDAFSVMLRPSSSTFSMRSALAFKYNPTINYSIELDRTMSGTVGVLRAALRTQNASLRLYVMQFLKLWVKIEEAYGGGSEYLIEDARFSKKLVLHGGGEISEEDISEAIVDYVCAFDSAIKAFFYNLDDTKKAVGEVEAIYRDYRSGAGILF